MIERPTKAKMNAPLRLAFGAFVVAAIGAAFAFVSDHFAADALGRVAYVVVAAAVVCGFVGIGWGWYRFFSAKPNGGR